MNSLWCSFRACGNPKTARQSANLHLFYNNSKQKSTVFLPSKELQTSTHNCYEPHRSFSFFKAKKRRPSTGFPCIPPKLCGNLYDRRTFSPNATTATAAAQSPTQRRFFLFSNNRN